MFSYRLFSPLCTQDCCDVFILRSSKICLQFLVVCWTWVTSHLRWMKMMAPSSKKLMDLWGQLRFANLNFLESFKQWEIWVFSPWGLTWKLFNWKNGCSLIEISDGCPISNVSGTLISPMLIHVSDILEELKKERRDSVIDVITKYRLSVFSDLTWIQCWKRTSVFCGESS